MEPQQVQPVVEEAPSAPPSSNRENAVANFFVPKKFQSEAA